MNLKSLYVSGMREVRDVARSIGVLKWWSRAAQKSRFGCWSRSLLAVYDLPDLVELDVPWWTFQASDAVETFLGARPNARVFEWGSGASTVWLAKRAGSVVAIEHDGVWAADVRRLAPNNVDVRWIPPSRRGHNSTPVLSKKSGFEGLDFTNYVAAITEEDGLFDVIVIDGRAREACFPRALNYLAPGGMIVFDNVDRARYRLSISCTKTSLRVQWTRGLTPCLPYPTQTALITTSGR